jgi:glycosyltransferase involved in cell wall biosynthesis
MRVALLHSFYSTAASSGENHVVMAQADALAAAGHEVTLIGRHTDVEQQHLSAYPVRAAWRTLSSRGPNPGPLLTKVNPDVVHIHNTVPNIGLQWLPRWPGAVVHTLHNYRPLCANGLLFRYGHLCTLCPDGEPWSAVVHACYRDSRVFTLPIATRNASGLRHNPLIRRADRLVVLSQFAYDIYRKYGVAETTLRLLPNGVATVNLTNTAAPVNPRWVVVGRLSAEKGIRELLDRWPKNQPLDIIGDGPLRTQIAEQALAFPAVRVLGHLPQEELDAMLPTYSGLIFAGLAPESALPLVVGEALGAGIPVVFASDHPQAGPLVSAGAATVAAPAAVAAPDSDGSIADALSWVIESGTAARARARHWYDDHLSVPMWINGLERIYHEAKEQRRHDRR